MNAYCQEKKLAQPWYRHVPLRKLKIWYAELELLLLVGNRPLMYLVSASERERKKRVTVFCKVCIGLLLLLLL